MPPRPVDALAAVQRAGQKAAVDPALDEGGHRKPVERKHEHQDVAGHQCIDFTPDVGRKGVVFERMALLQCVGEVVLVGALSEIASANDGIEVERI
jgi:hypothetical protein